MHTCIWLVWNLSWFWFHFWYNVKMEPATASYSVPSVHFLMIGVPFTCHSSPSWFPKKVDHLTPTSVHKHKVSQSTEVPLQTSVFYLNLLPIRAQVVDTEAKKNPSTHLQFHLCTFLPLLQRPAGRWSPSIESWLTTRVSISQLCLVHLQKRGVASFNTSNDLITLNKTRAGDDYSTD